MKYTRQQLEMLAKNPHFRMSDEQIRELEYYRGQDVKPDPKFKPQFTTIKKHNPKIRPENE